MKSEIRTMFPTIQDWMLGPYARICELAGSNRQAGVAKFLGIRQTLISDAKRRKTIPADWLLTVWKKTGVNPDWILSGQGGKYLRSVDEEKKENRAGTCRDCSDCPIETGIVELKRAVSACAHSKNIPREGACIIWFKSG